MAMPGLGSSGLPGATSWRWLTRSGTGSGSASAALGYFQDHPVSLGSFSSINSGSGFELNLTLSQTFTKAGAGFYGNFIVGDPDPPPDGARPEPAAAGQAQFAQALFDGFFGQGGTDAGASAVAVPSSTLFVAGPAAGEPAQFGQV